MSERPSSRTASDRASTSSDPERTAYAPVSAYSRNSRRLSDADSPQTQLNDLFNECAFGTVDIRIRLEIDDLTFTPNLIVTSVRRRLASTIIVGDQIILMNGKSPVTVDDAYSLIRRYSPHRIHITLGRPGYMLSVGEHHFRRLSISPQPTSGYFVVTVRRIGHLRMGLGIKESKGKVYVNRTDRNSIASFIFLLGDIIHSINGEPIKKGIVLRSRIMSAIRSDGKFRAVIERPPQPMAQHYIGFSAKAGALDPQMNSDVLEIGQRESLRCQTAAGKRWRLRSILQRPAVDATQEDRPSTPRRRRSSTDSAGKHRKVAINPERNQEKRIGTDVQNAALLQDVRDPAPSSGAVQLLLSRFFRNPRGSA